MERVTVAALQQMKREGRKIVGVVAYDYPTAQIADRAGVDLISVGDSVGVNLWGQPTETEVTVEEILLACKAVSRGAKRALVSCDIPYGPVQAGTQAAVSAAIRFAKEGGAGMVKILGGPETVSAIVHAGIPVFAEFHGGREIPVGKLVEEAKRLEEAGASLLDFRHSGPVAGAAVAKAVSIPVIGGLGGGPWLDGRVRSVFAAIGYLAAAVDDGTERYANVAQISLEAIKTFAEDVRAARQVRGAAKKAT